jgi:hypothetical protein
MKLETEAPARLVPARVGGNFVVLRADALRLLLPQQEVGAAEYIDGEPHPTGTPGLFEYGEGDGLRHVIALSGQMRALATFPQGRFVLTKLMADEGELSFAWNEVRVLIDARLEPHPLPAAMRVTGAPIDAYVEHEGELLLCSTAAQVLGYAAMARG